MAQRKLEAETHSRGRGSLTLDVSVENGVAQRLHERLAFNVTDERRSMLNNSYGHVPSYRRMQKTIG